MHILPRFYQTFLNGLFAQGLAQILNFFIRIFLPPLYIKAWGIEIYGYWLYITSIVTYIALSDLGTQQFFINRLTQEFSIGNKEKFNKLFSTGFLLYLLIPIILLLISMLVLILFPSCLATLKAKAQLEHLNAILLFIELQFLLGLPLGFLIGIYRAIDKLPKSIHLNNLNLFFNFSFTALLLFYHASPFYVGLAQNISFFLIGAYVVWDLQKRNIVFFKQVFKKANRQTAKESIIPSTGFFIIQIASAFNVQGIILLVGAFLGPAEIVAFSTMRTLTSFARQGVGMIMHTAWPELTKLDYQNATEKLKMLFRFTLRLSLFCVTLFLSSLYLLGDLIYGYWLDKAVYFDKLLFLEMIIYAFITNLYVVNLNLLMATNKHMKIIYFLSFSTILSFLLGYVALLFFGKHGLLIGMSISDLLLLVIPTPLIVEKYFPTITSRVCFGELAVWTCFLLLTLYSSWFMIVLCPFGIYFCYRARYLNDRVRA